MDEGGIKITKNGRVIVEAHGCRITLQLSPDELREMADTLEDVAEMVESDAAAAVDAAFAKASGGRLQ